MREALEDPAYQVRGTENKVFLQEESKAEKASPKAVSQPKAAVRAESQPPEGQIASASQTVPASQTTPAPGDTSRRPKWPKIIGALAALTACLALAWYIALPKEVTDVIGINETENIYIGDTSQFTYEVEPDRFSDEPITFQSSDPEVFTVDEAGRITGVSVGEADMTLHVKEFSKDIHINVIPKVTNMKDLKSSLSLIEGESSTMKPTLQPAKFADEAITFRSSKKSVASVSKKGKITAKKPGKATIMVSAGGCEEQVKVTVEAVPEPEPEPVVQPAYSGSNSGSSSSASKSKSKSKSSGSSKKSKKSSSGYFSSGDDEYF